MGILLWLSDHWLELLAAAGGPGLCLAAYARHQDTKATQNSNAIAVSQKQSELLRDLYTLPDLRRAVLDTADARGQAIPQDARFWLTSAILHLGLVFQLMRKGEFITVEGLQKDVRAFFTFPIRLAVWKEIREFQNREFVDFVEGCLKDS